MRIISVKKEYAREWERLMRRGAIEIDGKTARYISRVLSANGMADSYECYHNDKTRRTIFKLNRPTRYIDKKQRGWKRVGFCLSF